MAHNLRNFPMFTSSEVGKRDFKNKSYLYFKYRLFYQKARSDVKVQDEEGKLQSQRTRRSTEE